MLSLVDEVGKPFHPTISASLISAEQILKMADEFLKPSPIAQHWKIQELRKSCGVKPEPLTIRMWKPSKCEAPDA